jgi:hypothetical protein
VSLGTDFGRGVVPYCVVCAACNHPSLVNKDYKMDQDAIDPKAKGNDADDDDADDLATMFGSLGVTSTKRCQVCQTLYVIFVVLF